MSFINYKYADWNRFRLSVKVKYIIQNIYKDIFVSLNNFFFNNKYRNKKKLIIEQSFEEYQKLINEEMQLEDNKRFKEVKERKKVKI